MQAGTIMKFVSAGCVITALGLFAYVVNASNMLSYLSSDSQTCINCHVMDAHYASWQNSSHREVGCVECHLPRDSFVGKMSAKARDGFNHSVAFTLGTYSNSMRATDDASRRIQANCISCHQDVVAEMLEYGEMYQSLEGGGDVARRCWDCHRGVPHGFTRGLLSYPGNLSVKEL